MLLDTNLLKHCLGEGSLPHEEPPPPYCSHPQNDILDITAAEGSVFSPLAKMLSPFIKQVNVRVESMLLKDAHVLLHIFCLFFKRWLAFFTLLFSSPRANDLCWEIIYWVRCEKYWYKFMVRAGSNPGCRARFCALTNWAISFTNNAVKYINTVLNTSLTSVHVNSTNKVFCF